MTHRPITLLGLLALLAPALAGQAAAQQATDIVGLFDRLCYATMPDIDAVETAAADGAWQALAGQELDAFRPAVEPEVLKAWTFSDQGSSFSLAVTRSPMDDQSRTDFPNYANATNFACSLILPSGAPAPAAVGAELEKLVGRAPDAGYDDGPFKVSAWSGGNDQLMVLLYHYAPQSGAPGGLLSMTVFENP